MKTALARTTPSLFSSARDLARRAARLGDLLRAPEVTAASPGLPRFVDRGGEQVLRPPYLHESALLRGFVFDVDPARLDAICRDTFRAPSGGAVDVRPRGRSVALTFTTIPRMTSQHPLDRGVGVTTEGDVAVWFPADVTVGGRASRAWVMPFIAVDNPIAVTVGREQYGFPKFLGEMVAPDVDLRETYSLDALAIARHGREAYTRRERILEVVPAEGGRDAAQSALAMGGLTLDGVRFDGAVPVLFLRQLRDIEDPSRAAFQEVVVAPAVPRAARRGGWLPGAWTVRVNDLDSHPLARDLGVARETPARAAFWSDFDFVMEAGRTLWRAGGQGAVRHCPPRRERIAVLGGGLGALSAVWALTKDPSWRERYEVTVYQQGWRLGGKGASGRNEDVAQRIEEHGLHVWFGFYENAFKVIREAYEELGRAPGEALATWRDAFEPQHGVVLQEETAAGWEPWELTFPPNDRVPGDGEAPTPAALAAQLARYAVHSLRSLPAPGPALALPDALSAVGAAAVSALDALSGALDASALRTLRGLRDRLARAFTAEAARNTPLRRAWIAADFALTNLVGILADDVPGRGFEALDDEDYVRWLTRHGASPLTRWCAPVRAGYDLTFAFRDGDPARPDLAAGTALQGLLRMMLGYSGAFMWKMRAGMGDVVFTPLYEVLRRRGVRFEFFHRVESVALSEDGARVARVEVARQATVRDGDYAPLVDVKGLACWPDRPRYAQLVEGDALRDGGIDLESSASAWEPVARRTLRVGEDFDRVVLGIPVAALRHVAADLVARLPAWRAMVDGVPTAATVAMQLWTRPDARGLGAPAYARPAVQGAFAEPLDTWADMTHLVPVEDWPASQTPGHIGYFCGPLDVPAARTAEEVARGRARARQLAERFVHSDLLRLWPAARAEVGGFDHGVLMDLEGREGAARFEGQLLKANVEPTDRYTQSHAGTWRHRLRADGAGVENLFLAGDWVRTGFNCGCVEATVMSGLQCAAAVERTAAGARALAR